MLDALFLVLDIAELSDGFFTAATDAVAAATGCYDMLRSANACCKVDLSIIFINHMHKVSIAFIDHWFNQNLKKEI